MSVDLEYVVIRAIGELAEEARDGFPTFLVPWEKVQKKVSECLAPDELEAIKSRLERRGMIESEGLLATDIMLAAYFRRFHPLWAREVKDVLREIKVDDGPREVAERHGFGVKKAALILREIAAEKIVALYADPPIGYRVGTINPAERSLFLR